MEFSEEERGVRQRLTEWPLERLLKNGLVVVGLQAEGSGRFYGDHLVRFSFRSGRQMPRHEFQRGDEVSVSSEGSVATAWELLNEEGPSEPQKDKPVTYQAQVVSVVPEAIFCVMQRAPPTGKTWRLDSGINSIVYQRTLEALSEFPTAWCDAVRRIIVGGMGEDIEVLNKWTGPSPLSNVSTFALSDSQQEAVKSLGQRRISLIQGPPGCGKTYTACTMLQAMRTGNGPLLATADSHVAVDQLLGGLLERGVNAVRIGHPASINDDLRRVSLPALIESHPHREECERLRYELKEIQGRVGRLQQLVLQPRGRGGQQAKADDQHTIVLSRESAEDQPLGADFELGALHGRGQALRVARLHREGLLPEWNCDNPGAGAWEGDCVLEVNGVSGDPACMRRLLSERLALRIVVKRDAQQLLREAEEEQRKMRGKVREAESQMIAQIIGEAEVVCSTLAGCGGESLRRLTFDSVLIDEATQASVPRALIAVNKLGGDSARLVLVGDQCQLPPTCLSQEAARLGLGVSLFERLLEMSDDLRPVMLTTQFRMHPLISSWPSSAFYGGRLLDSARARGRKPAPGFPWPKAGPVAFLKVCGREAESAGGASKSNYLECSTVGRVVRRFLRHVPAKDIGVISPYRGQVGLMKESLPRGVEVRTVDGFQGREKPIIIFSCVRSNPEGRVGFLADKRRLNVALTRAQRGLVVVGNPRTLRRDEVWSGWLRYVRRHGLVVNLDEGEFEELPRRPKRL